MNANWNAENGGWNLNANSVTNLNKWNAGNQVVSRYSSVSLILGWEFLLILFSNHLVLCQFLLF